MSQQLNFSLESKKQSSITENYSPKYRKILKPHEKYSNQYLQIMNSEEVITEPNNAKNKVIELSKQPTFKKGFSLVDNERGLKQNNFRKQKSFNDNKQCKNIMQEMNNQIKSNFFQLGLIIQKTGRCYQERMKTHQNQLLKIVFGQIKRIQQQCERTIYKYNKLIKSKMNNQQLTEARQQIIYFKQRALNINQQNQGLKKQIKHFKKILYEMEIKLKNQYQVIKDLSYKLVKYKTINRQKANQIHQINKNIQCLPNKLQKSLSLTTPTKGYGSGRITQNLKQKVHFSLLSPAYSIIKNQSKLSPLSDAKRQVYKKQVFYNLQNQIRIKLNKQKQIRQCSQNRKQQQIENTQTEGHMKKFKTQQGEVKQSKFQNRRLKSIKIVKSRELKQSFQQYMEKIKAKADLQFQQVKVNFQQKKSNIK